MVAISGWINTGGTVTAKIYTTVSHPDGYKGLPWFKINSKPAHDEARMGESWYRRHSLTFLREFHERKHIILYANGADTATRRINR